MLKVLHLTPSYFGDGSVVGGAERYAWELARAMAARAEVTFYTLADRSSTADIDGVRVVHASGRPLLAHALARNPCRWQLYTEIRRADVVHCYQVHTFLTAAAIAASRAAGRRVFVTDLGGGHAYAPTNYAPLLRLATGMLLISEYSRDLWASLPSAQRPDVLDVIYAGVDTAMFTPAPEQPASAEVLFVGRLLPHKGIEYLVDAIEPPLSLRIVGRAYDPAYVAMLQERARGKDVVFESDVNDDGLVHRYRAALAVVLPSVAVDWRGHRSVIAELFGLVVIEGMACGRPAIVSRTAALPELVDEGVTGFVVPPGDSRALRARLLELFADRTRCAEMGRRARARVEERYTWSATVNRCLAAYERA